MVPIGTEIPWPEWQTSVLKATWASLRAIKSQEFIVTGQAAALQSQARVVKTHYVFVFEGPKCGSVLPRKGLPKGLKANCGLCMTQKHL